MSDRQQYLEGMRAGLQFALENPELAREAIEIADLELILVAEPQNA